MDAFNRHKLNLLAATIVGLGAVGGAQAATLSCASPSVHVVTSSAADWTTDAVEVASGNGATIVDDYGWSGWMDPADVSADAKWLSFGAEGDGTPGQWPAVKITNGTTAEGYVVPNRATLFYNEPITIANDVDLTTLKITGTGGADNSALLVVQPATVPDPAVTDWLVTTSMLGGTWGSPAAIDMDGRTGFYYGDNTIGFALSSEPTTASLPAGIVADFDITAECLPPPPPPPQALICRDANDPTKGLPAGTVVSTGQIVTSKAGWEWAYKTNGSGGLEAVPAEQRELYDDFVWRSYMNPATLTGTGLSAPTTARWLSQGTTNPAGADMPYVPYPAVDGLSRSGFFGSIYNFKTPIEIGNNVDLATIKIVGRMANDDTGETVVVTPAGQPFADPHGSSSYLPDGYTGFSSLDHPVSGFQRGENQIGIALNSGQFGNDCPTGVCAQGLLAEFEFTAVCTGADPTPIAASGAVTPVPTLDLAGLGLLSLLGAGAGALALRRRRAR